MVAEPTRTVLFVLANGGRGGMQSQVRLIAASLARRGCDVTVAVGGGDFDGIDDVHVVALPEFVAARPLPFVRAWRRLVRHYRPDVVHAHGLRLAPLARWTGAKYLVVSCHGLDPSRARRTVRAVRRSPVTFVSCGEGPRELLARYGLSSRVLDNAFEPATTLHTSHELRRRYELAPNVPIAILPARFSDQKNHRQLLDALRLVREQLSDRSPEVLCFGDGPLFAVIDQMSRVDGGRPLVRCADFLDNASSWFAATDFFILPSTWEGQPMVVLEALANGLSVVSSTPTGLDDLILDGRNGRLVSGARELADVIVAWTNDPATRPRDAALTTEVLRRHGVEVVTDSYLALYSELRRRR